MKLIWGILLLLCSLSSLAADKAFYRLNIVNEKGELLLLKIKNSELWVTPGFYQEPASFREEQLNSLATDYGLNITQPNLQGIFEVSPSNNMPFQLRYFYHAISRDVVHTMPDFIEATQWKTLSEAVALIKPQLPHLALLIEHTQRNPENTWRAKLQRSEENDSPSVELIEAFRVLTVN